MRTLLLTTTLLLAACALSSCARGDGEAEAPAEARTTDAVASVEEGRAEVGAGRDAPAADERWAVAAAHPLATEAGARILSEGGTAVDAAVAVQAVLTLVEPQSSGLGGGAFMLFYDASTDAVTAYDGRETAPASAAPDMFLTEAGTPVPFYDAVTSGRSVGVPGVVAMLALAHERHGRLGWADLFADAERHAEDGFAVTPRLAGLLERIPRLRRTPAAAELFYEADGTALDAGDTLRNPAYAATLRTLAAGGPASFYTGSVADEIVAAVNERAGPGTMTREDLAGYRPVAREPVCAEVVTYDVCSMGPPSSGGVTVLQVLELFERAYGPNTGVLLPYVEASRLAYADRDRYLADPDYMGVGEADGAAVTQALLAAPYLDARAALIGEVPAEAAQAGEPVAPPVREGRAANEGYSLPSTSHFSVRDAYGNVVSMTTSVEFAFGSHLMAGGMILNNQLTDFARDPSETEEPAANAPAPGKRPRSSMSPVIALEDGEPVIAIGSPGGPAIIGYVARTLIGRLFLDQTLQEAVERPHVVTAREGVTAETEEVAEELRAAGYEDVTVRDLTSGLYGFEVVGDEVVPAVDARREGTFESGEL